MKKSLIPWHVFLDAIAAQAPGLLESWLNRWGFTNDGVVLISVETHSRGPGLPLGDYKNRQSDVARSAGQASILRDLLDTGCLLSEETVELWSYIKEL
jgi:hypothetical protein